MAEILLFPEARDRKIERQASTEETAEINELVVLPDQDLKAVMTALSNWRRFGRTHNPD
jgi:hypothetical protein